MAASKLEQTRMRQQAPEHLVMVEREADRRGTIWAVILVAHPGTSLI
jgi:hypothetical protein